MALRRDVTFGLDGRLHFMNAADRPEASGTFVAWIDVVEIPIPDAALDGRIAATEDGTVALAARGYRDEGYVVTSRGDVRILDKVAGNNAMGIVALPGNRFKVVEMEGVDKRRTLILNSDLTTVDAPGSDLTEFLDEVHVEGILDVDPDVQMVSDASPLLINGVWFHKPMTRGRFTVGLKPSPNWVLLYDDEDPDAVYTVFRGDVKLPPRIAVDAEGRFTVAVSDAGVGALLDELNLQLLTRDAAPPDDEIEALIQDFEDDFGDLRDTWDAIKARLRASRGA